MSDDDHDRLAELLGDDENAEGAALARPIDPAVLARAGAIVAGYHVEIKTEDAPGESTPGGKTFYGTVAEMRGVMADGATEEACRASTIEAAVAAVATMIEQGQTPPPPAPAPAPGGSDSASVQDPSKGTFGQNQTDAAVGVGGNPLMSPPAAEGVNPGPGTAPGTAQLPIDLEREAKLAARRQTLARVTAIRNRLAEIGDPEAGRRAANDRANDLRATRDATVKRLDKELGEAEAVVRKEQAKYVVMLDEKNALAKELAGLEPLLAERP